MVTAPTLGIHMDMLPKIYLFPRKLLQGYNDHPPGLSKALDRRADGTAS